MGCVKMGGCTVGWGPSPSTYHQKGTWWVKIRTIPHPFPLAVDSRIWGLFSGNISGFQNKGSFFCRRVCGFKNKGWFSKECIRTVKYVDL